MQLSHSFVSYSLMHSSPVKLQLKHLQVRVGLIKEKAIRCSKVFLLLVGEVVMHMTLLIQLLLTSIHLAQFKSLDLEKLSPPSYSKFAKELVPPCIIRLGWEVPTGKLSFP